MASFAEHYDTHTHTHTTYNTCWPRWDLVEDLCDNSPPTILTGHNEIELEYLDVTVLRRGVGEVRVVVGRVPACSTGVLKAFITELETSARSENKRMTNHNTPQLSRMDLANHCAAFPVLSRLNTRAVTCCAFVSLPCYLLTTLQIVCQQIINRRVLVHRQQKISNIII
jgi:hypothetical protein